MNHEEALIRAFADPARADRYLKLLQNRRGRGKLQAELAHRFALDARFAHLISPSEQSPEQIARLLQQKGAPARCYCFSDDKTVDGQELELQDALSRVVGRQMGTLLSCVPGRLGYYEAEDPGERYILERRESARR